MMDDRARALVDAEIDGVLADADREELDQLAEASDEIRVYRVRMQELDNLLTDAPRIEPPDRLHADIMNAIQLPAAAAERWNIGLRLMPGWLRYGVGAAAALVLAVGVFEYRNEPKDAFSPSMVSGTTLPDVRADSIELDQARFSADALTSTVTLSRRGQLLALDVEMAADEPVSLVLEFAESELMFDSMTPAPSPPDGIQLLGQGLRVAASGQRQFTILLRQSTAEAEGQLSLTWSNSAGVLQKKDFSINKKKSQG